MSQEEKLEPKAKLGEEEVKEEAPVKKPRAPRKKKEEAPAEEVKAEAKAE